MRSAINGQVAPSLSSHNYYIDDYDYSDNYFVGIGNSCGLVLIKASAKETTSSFVAITADKIVTCTKKHYMHNNYHTYNYYYGCIDLIATTLFLMSQASLSLTNSQDGLFGRLPPIIH